MNSSCTESSFSSDASDSEGGPSDGTSLPSALFWSKRCTKLSPGKSNLLIIVLEISRTNFKLKVLTLYYKLRYTEKLNNNVNTET